MVTNSIILVVRLSKISFRYILMAKMKVEYILDMIIRLTLTHIIK